MGGCEDAADAAVPVDIQRRVNSVAFPVKTNIHNHKCRPHRPRQSYGLIRVPRHAYDIKSRLAQRCLNIESDQEFILDEKNFACRGRSGRFT